MLTVFIADQDVLNCIKRKIRDQEDDNRIESITLNGIKTDSNQWIFVNYRSNWFDRLRGLLIDRLYLCSDCFPSIDDVKKQVSFQVRGGSSNIVCFDRCDINFADSRIGPEPKPVTGGMELILSYRMGNCLGCKWHPNVCKYCMRELDTKE